MRNETIRNYSEKWIDKLTTNGREPLILSLSKGHPELVEGSS